MNNLAIRRLMRGMPDHELIRLSLVVKKDIGWEEGLFSSAWEFMEREYRVRDQNAELKLSNDLAKLSMKSGADPDDMFKQVDKLHLKYEGTNVTFDDSRKISAMMRALPKTYRERMLLVAGHLRACRALESSKSQSYFNIQ